MLKFYGLQPPETFVSLRVGGICPHCKTATRFTRVSDPITSTLTDDEIPEVVISYSCDTCLRAVPILWDVLGTQMSVLVIGNPREILPSTPPFDFGHVPPAVASCIKEALTCFAASAYNGFASQCRRSIQALCTDLGAEATSKVKRQIEELAVRTDLGDDLTELALQLMLSGHDGSHPHLPELDSIRAEAMIPLLQDLTYELYTRAGRVKEIAALRQNAIKARPSE